MNNDQDINDENPWPGLESYNESASKWFYGREEEVDTLLRLIDRETLSVLYGRSGMGKTSLIQAGLFPRLREIGYLPVRLRLVLADDAGSLRVQIGEAIARECKKYSIQARPYDGTVSLWEYFFQKGGEFWSVNDHLIIPVLVFDQFEEFFTFGRENAKRRERCEFLMAEIGDLVENRRPVALRAQIEGDESIASHFDSRRPPPKILFSFREDYLADFDILSNYLHAGTVNRMRLLPMMGDKAQAAIVAVSPKHVSPEVAVEIVRFVAADQQSQSRPLAELPVEPFLLSLICRELNLRRQASGLQHIAVDLLTDTQIEILNNFYTRCLKDSPPALVKFIEEKLISEDGKHRINVVLADATRLPKVRRDSIDTLVDRRLLRVEKRSGTERMELIHDVLTLVAMNSRNARHRREYFKKFGSVLLGVLVIMSVLIFQLLEIRYERDKAKVERDRANLSEGRARDARENAEKAEGEAKDARDDAQKKEGIAKDQRNKATSRMLAIHAQEILDGKSEKPLAQGVLLAMEAYRLTPELLTRDGLMKARQQSVIPYIELPPILDAYSVFRGIFYQGDKLFGMSQLVDDKEKKIQLWDISKQDRAGEFSLGQGPPPVFTFSYDGKVMAKTEYVAKENYSIQLFDMVKQQPMGEPLRLAQGPHQPSALALRKDGNILAVAVNGDIQLWDVNSRTRLDVNFFVNNMNVTGLAFSPDGKTLAAAGFNLYLFEADNGAAKGNALQINENVASLVYSPDGNTIAFAVDQDIQLWDVNKQMIIGICPRNVGDKGRVCFLAFSPDSKTLAVAGNNSLRLLDRSKFFPAFSPLILINNSMGNFYSSALSMDGKIMVTTITTENKRLALQLWDVVKRAPMGSPITLTGASPLLSFALSKHGETMAVLINYKGNVVIQLWDVAKREPIGEPLGFKQGNPGHGNALAFSPDAKTLAAGGSEGIQLFDLIKRESMGKPLSTTPQLRGKIVASLAFSRDGKVLAAGGDFNAGVATKNEYRAIQLWDVAKREFRNELVGLDQRTATSLAFSQDGKTLAVGGGNGARGSGGGAIQLWDLDLRRRLKTELIVGNNVNVKSLAFSRDGKNLLAVDGRNLVSWDLDIVAWPAHLCNQVQRNLTALEWADSIGGLMPYHKTCPDLPNGK